MCLHLRPITLVHIGGQNHESVGAVHFGSLGERYCFLGRQRRNGCDHGDLALDRTHQGFNDGELFVHAQRCRLAERTQRHQSADSVFDLPAGVARDELVIDLQVLIKCRRQCWHDSSPLHIFPRSRRVVRLLSIAHSVKGNMVPARFRVAGW